jgi:NAD(P)-dependent dehydrogenase (short-subunit alcohol dehydrogenase family)
MLATARYDFSGCTVAVVGASGVLGSAAVHAFQDAGAHVIATAHRPIKGLAAEPSLELRNFNAADEAQVARFFESVGPLDAVVNVIGGYAAGHSVADLDVQTLEDQLRLNLRPAFLLTKYAVRTMREAGRGHVVHVASRAAVESGKDAFAYSASKQAVTRLVEAAAAENKQTGITINCVLPSIIDTPINREAMPKADYTRWPKPAQLARVLLFLASDDASLISGASIPVYGRA